MVITAKRVIEDRDALTTVFMGADMYRFILQKGDEVDDLTGMIDTERTTGVQLTLKNSVEQLKSNCIQDSNFFNALQLFNFIQSPIITLLRYHDTGHEKPNLSGSPLAFWKHIELMPSYGSINVLESLGCTFEE